MSTVAIIFLILLLLNVPLAFCIGVSSLFFFVVTDGVTWITPVQRMVAQTQSFPLLAVPFFVLAGNLMNETGITSRMIAFSTILSGHMRGGLAQVSVVLSTLMGGISGSAVADAAMESRVLGPDMIKRGYSKGFIAAILAMGGLITATIPPGVGLILYGVTGGVSIGRLFVAGIIPGLLMMVMLMIAVTLVARRRGYPPEREKKPNAAEVWKGFKDSVWALIFPVLLIGGIRFGWFTASEAGAFAVVYAFVVGVFIYREIPLSDIGKIIFDSAKSSAMILFIIATSTAFSWFFAFSGISRALINAIIALDPSPMLFNLVVAIILLIFGTFLEGIAICVLLVPVLWPIAESLGINVIHFGLCVSVAVMIGCMTPPVAVNLFAASSVTGLKMGELAKGEMPFLIGFSSVFFILVLVPWFSTFFL